MSDATISKATIRPEEAEHFGALAEDWWNPAGSSALLHRMNPLRLAFIREAIDAHWGLSRDSVRPLSGKRALDVGCGAGLLAEPLSRMGADTTGVDAAPENIAAAKAHAEGMGLSINYRAGELESLSLGPFDLVTSMEVLEHVADKAAFLAQLTSHVAPGGLLILSTPNRTAQSQLLMISAAEGIGAIPRGTHHWDDFVTPEELAALLADVGFAMGEPKGIAYSPLKGLHLGDNLSLDYIVTATRQ